MGEMVKIRYARGETGWRWRSRTSFGASHEQGA